jgi:hypothetical protein
VSKQIIESRFPVNKALALELAALMAQVQDLALQGYNPIIISFIKTDSNSIGIDGGYV